MAGLVFMTAGVCAPKSGTSSPMKDLLDELLDLERAGWQSLCDSTGSDHYGNLMTDSGRMVLANGAVMSRDDVIDALKDAAPWSSFSIDDPVATALSDDVAAIIYSGTGHTGDGEDFIGVMTSVYVRRVSRWKLVLYQQTATPRS